MRTRVGFAGSVLAWLAYTLKTVVAAGILILIISIKLSESTGNDDNDGTASEDNDEG